jgi:competence protein ComEC
LQVGFQLSFAAVAAIVVFYPILIRYLTFDKWAWNSVGKLIAVSLAAQAGTLPFTLYYFHQFPGLFLLSNLILLPGLGVLLVMGLACMSLELLIELPRAVADLLDGLLGVMNRYVHWAAAQDVFFLEGISMTQVEFACSVMAIFLLGIYLKTRRHQVLYGIVILLLLFQGAGILQNARGFKKESWVIPHQVAHTMVWKRKGARLEVAATDPEKGGSLVRDAQNHWGIRNTEYSPVTPFYSLGNSTLRVLDRSGLYSPGEPHPDYLLLSGSPQVHLGRVLQVLKPGMVIADGSNYTNDVKRWKKSCAEKGIPFHATTYDGAYEIEVPRE